MKQIFISIFLVSLFFNFSNAEEVKPTKETKQPMSDEEFMKQWEELEQRKQKAKEKTEEAKKRGKALDEIINQLSVDKK